jgi:hypothetical protein
MLETEELDLKNTESSHNTLLSTLFPSQKIPINGSGQDGDGK